MTATSNRTYYHKVELVRYLLIRDLKLRRRLNSDD
jgi:hypothetical protein